MDNDKLVERLAQNIGRVFNRERKDVIYNIDRKQDAAITVGFALQEILRKYDPSAQIIFQKKLGPYEAPHMIDIIKIGELYCEAIRLIEEENL